MISSELKEILKQVKEKNNNGIDLLKIVKAFEETYKCIKISNLNEVSNFSEEFDSKYRISKKGYNELNHKMVYDVNMVEDNSDLFSIEVKNNGNIRFQTTVSTPTTKEVISLLNRPNCDILERLKMNAEVSFFSENCELVISKNPYLALKISDSLDSDKAVLVWKKDNKCQNIAGGVEDCEYVRVEQIEPYLKNIKIDSQIIPQLTYAFFGNRKEREALQVYAIEQYDNTYPKLTKDRIKSIDENLFSNLENVFTIGLSGAFIGGFLGLLFMALTQSALPVIIGAASPLVIAAAIAGKMSVDYSHAQKKDEKVAIAQVNLYKKLKNYASYHIKEIVNSEPVLIQEEKNKSEIEKPMDLARGIKSLIANVSREQAEFYNIQLLQIINAYDNETEPTTKTTQMYSRLSQLSNEIADSKEKNLYEVIASTITFVSQINKETNMLTGLQMLTEISSSMQRVNTSSLKFMELHDLETQLTYSFIETIMNNDINFITEETLENISQPDKQNILSTITLFMNQEGLPNINNKNKKLEEQILASLSLIQKNDMQDKLLNKKEVLKPYQKTINN